MKISRRPAGCAACWTKFAATRVPAVWKNFRDRENAPALLESVRETSGVDSTSFAARNRRRSTHRIHLAVLAFFFCEPDRNASRHFCLAIFSIEPNHFVARKTFAVITFRNRWYRFLVPASFLVH